MVPVQQQQEEAIYRIEDDVVVKERQVDADEPARGEAEETYVPAEIGVAGVESVAFGQHHPPSRVEARIYNAAATRAEGTLGPVGADGAEADVIQQVAGQHTPPYKLHQILGQRSPWPHFFTITAIGSVPREAAALAAIARDCGVPVAFSSRRRRHPGSIDPPQLPNRET